MRFVLNTHNPEAAPLYVPDAATLEDGLGKCESDKLIRATVGDHERWLLTSVARALISESKKDQSPEASIPETDHPNIWADQELIDVMPVDPLYTLARISPGEKGATLQHIESLGRLTYYGTIGSVITRASLHDGIRRPLFAVRRPNCPPGLATGHQLNQIAPFTYLGRLVQQSRAATADGQAA
jgi:hypothetical protein